LTRFGLRLTRLNTIAGQAERGEQHHAEALQRKRSIRALPWAVRTVAPAAAASVEAPP
jgi:hypothetical protein